MENKRASINPLQELKDLASKAAFGMTKAEAHGKNICVSCKQSPVVRNEIEKQEYLISGICGICFYEITKETI